MERIKPNVISKLFFFGSNFSFDTKHKCASNLHSRYTDASLIYMLPHFGSFYYTLDNRQLLRAIYVRSNSFAFATFIIVILLKNFQINSIWYIHLTNVWYIHTYIRVVASRIGRHHTQLWGRVRIFMQSISKMLLSWVTIWKFN